MLPDKQYENGFFTDAPRRVLSALLRKGGSVGGLLEWMSDPAEIERRLAGTPQAAYLDREAGAQRAGVLSSMNMIADSLDLLPETAEGRRWFTTEKWKWERTDGCSLLRARLSGDVSCRCMRRGSTCSSSA